MGLKKRSKVSAEFSMSSLTDIIFLLLIFFMLTSSLVSPNALNMEMPTEGKSNAVTSSKIDEVRIDNKSKMYFNGRRTNLKLLETQIGTQARKKGKGKYKFILSPGKRTPVEAVVGVMDIAMRHHTVPTLAPEK